jgi:hypothetical protein
LLSEEFLSAANPFLLDAEIASALLLGIGIVFESHKFNKGIESVQNVGFWCVVFGVVFETVFSILLFGSEGSIANQQRAQIIALDKQIAPRRLSPPQIRALVARLSPFSNKTVRVTSYALDFEAAFLGVEIITALSDAGVHFTSALLCEAPVGSIVLGIHVTGSDDDLVKMLLGSFSTLNFIVDPSPVPPSMLSCGGQNTPGIDATIFVATKPPPDVIQGPLPAAEAPDGKSR